MTSTETAVYQSLLGERRGRLESARGRNPHSSEIARLLDEVDSALARIEVGTYGLCEECHDPIEPERLLADPTLCFCIDHLSVAERRALEEDLHLAQRIQATLLPQRAFTHAGWAIATRYEPAGPVSGDYCDVVSPANGGSTLLCLIGDVAGKGVAASLLMSHLHAIFRSLAGAGASLPGLVEQANRLFCESTLPSHYATLVGARLAAGGEVEFCNAGHCPPLLVSGGRITALDPAGLPLGLFCGTRYGSSTLRMNAGDRLVFYTDGITEAAAPSGEFYGLDRLCARLAADPGLDGSGLADACRGDVEAFRAGSPRTDDLTVMVISRAAPGS